MWTVSELKLILGHLAGVAGLLAVDPTHLVTRCQQYSKRILCNEDNGAFPLRPAITSAAMATCGCMFGQLWCFPRVGVC